MKKLSLPVFSSNESYLTCVAGIIDDDLRARYEEEVNLIERASIEYTEKASTAELYTIPVLNTRNDDHIVIGGLTKAQLTKLYSYYMVKKDPARNIYDEIKASANGKCPFCGGIGQPYTLDHYLPKANYPQFSVLPLNLVPSCRDCNTGKGTSVALASGQQVLHPYFEENCFYLEKWITAKIIHSAPITIEFYVDPPNAWSSTFKERTVAHFNSFDLSSRFSVQVGDEIAMLNHQRSTIMSNYTTEIFKQYLNSVVEGAPFINHWRAVMYSGLLADDIFCSMGDT